MNRVFDARRYLAIKLDEQDLISHSGYLQLQYLQSASKIFEHIVNSLFECLECFLSERIKSLDTEYCKSVGKSLR